MGLMIEPNYELFVQLLFVLLIFRMIINFISGIAQTDILKRDKAGGLEIFAAIIQLVIIIWVLI